MPWNSHEEAAPPTDIFKATEAHTEVADDAAYPVNAVRLRRRTDVSEEIWTHIRRKRMRTTGMFSLAYAAVLLVSCSQGLIAGGALAGILAAIVLAQLVLYGLFAGGWNRNMQEKTLALPISVGSLIILLAAAYLSPAGRIAYAPFAFVAVGQGLFRLTRHTLFMLGSVAVAGYGVVLGLLQWQGEPLAQAVPQWLLWLSLAPALPGFALLAGRRGRRLHRELHMAGAGIRYIKEHDYRDPRLGCYSRRYMTAVLEAAKRSADETGLPLCLAVIDLDHFKRINDEIGHLGADEVLRSFVRVVLDCVRRQDVFGRYRGKEFLLVLPRTTLLAALQTAERVRERTEKDEWAGLVPWPLTVSIGLTQYIPGESVLDLFSRADNAVYLAKRGGRNQVVVEEPGAQTWESMPG